MNLLARIYYVSISELTITGTYLTIVFNFFLQEQFSFKIFLDCSITSTFSMCYNSYHCASWNAPLMANKRYCFTRNAVGLFLINALIAYRARICLKCGEYNMSLITGDPYRFTVRWIKKRKIYVRGLTDVKIFLIRAWRRCYYSMYIHCHAGRLTSNTAYDYLE